MQPDLLTIPFGKDAASGAIDPIPDTPGAGDPPQKATWSTGFPIVTMTPLSVGGIPPRGQDFNGILKAISEHTVYLCGGGAYKWNSEIVSVGGGYAKGAVVQSDDGLSSYVSAIDGNTVNFNTSPGSIGTQWLAWAGSAKANASITISAGTGLSGGGNLSANRTLSVVYGTGAGTSAQGNDTRITGAAQKSANLSDLSSADTARSNLGLGTAATATLTISTTDVSGSRVTKVGDFGLGATSLTGSTPLSDWNSVLPSGLYAPVGGSNNAPAWGEFGVILNMNRANSGETCFQVAGNADSANPRIGFRFGVSTGFKELFHTNNVSPYAQTLLDDSDASAARTTLGLGTAATRASTASNNDETSGRLVKNGDAQVCTAQGQFNGTGTVALRGSFGVSSIGDEGVGRYAVNFSAAKANNTYSAVANYTSDDTGSPTNNDGQACCYQYTPTSFKILVSNGAAQAQDPLRCSFVVFGGA